MFKKQLTINIEELDKKIGKLNEKLSSLEEEDEDYELTVSKIEDLTDIRCKLSESKVKSSIKPLVVSGVFGVATTVIVLRYEKTEVITSKAFNMVTGMFRGSK